MAVSVIEICNNALLDLGEETIMSLSDDSKPARLCNQRWPGVRDAVLRAHPWNCCTAQAVLAADAAPPAWRRSFAYPLTASTSLAQALWKVYEDKLTEARGADAREAGSPPPSPAAWLSAKLGKN